jgi:hypothetical protein
MHRQFISQNSNLYIDNVRLQSCIFFNVFGSPFNLNNVDRGAMIIIVYTIIYSRGSNHVDVSTVSKLE